MRIALTTHALIRAGAERQLALLAAGLDQQGHEVTVIVLRGGGALTESLTARGIRVVELSNGERPAVLAVWRLPLALRRAKPDVVYSVLTLPNIAAVASRLLNGRIPTVIGVRGEQPERPAERRSVRAVYWLEARLARFASSVIVNSAAARDWVVGRGFPADRVTIIHNGIALNEAGPDARARWRQRWEAEADAIVVGRVGGLRPVKDYPTFLRAAALVVERLPHARFVCIGGGPADAVADLEVLTSSLGLRSRVIWAGEIDEVADAVSAFDVAVSSSRSESFPNVVAEAMASGVPCVVTDVGESAQIVGETGLVVPPADPDALADAIFEFGRMTGSARREMGGRARARIADRYSVDAMVARTVDVLERVAA